jgi:mono/diheme cytochrome c family protein
MILTTTATLPSEERTQNAPASTSSGVFSTEQAKRGKALFMANCAVCHGANLLPRDGDATALTGPDFELAWHGQTIGERVERMQASMPPENPGNLTGQQYVDVVAHILEFNGYPAGQQELTFDLKALKQIRIEPAPAHK